jgi:hypothetical protein
MLVEVLDQEIVLRDGVVEGKWRCSCSQRYYNGSKAASQGSSRMGLGSSPIQAIGDGWSMREKSQHLYTLLSTGTNSARPLPLRGVPGD